jgi:hypothetical protein
MDISIDSWPTSVYAKDQSYSCNCCHKWWYWMCRILHEIGVKTGNAENCDGVLIVQVQYAMWELSWQRVWILLSSVWVEEYLLIFYWFTYRPGPIHPFPISVTVFSLIACFCTLKMKASGLSKMLINTYQATWWYHIPEGSTVYVQYILHNAARRALVGIVTGYRLDDCGVRVQVPIGKRNFSSQLPDHLFGPPSLVSNGY